ncbi:hypothetical protein [Aestuariivita boseongensis]|uniref:GspE/PulE/PilB domain-containing protein n=1 Tax=Aestuariivita boseongensis TaxID=1470562 RepID=UPI000B1098B8|nr:hypothetical protein [Aestuariivita boseongensis]
MTLADILAVVAQQNTACEIDLVAEPPDKTLARLAPRDVWLTHCAVPWRRLGTGVLVATPRPDQLAALRTALPADFPQIIPVISSEEQVMGAIACLFRADLTAQAETRVASMYSCRHWEKLGLGRALVVLGLAASLLGGLVLSPGLTFSVICAFAILCLFTITLLKLTAALAHIGHRLHVDPPAPQIPAGRWPRISVMVPLFKETEIADALIERLQKITYPKVLLDVILVLEEKDTLTRATLAACDLPRVLLRDLGWKRFLGLQAFFIGTLSQFLFAPILWTFWLKMLAVPHPTESVFEHDILFLVATLFVMTEVVNLGIALCAAARKEHRFLIPWELTLPLYFPLGAIASYKELYEVLVKPFYWDKTQHGHSEPDKGAAV